MIVDRCRPLDEYEPDTVKIVMSVSEAEALVEPYDDDENLSDKCLTENLVLAVRRAIRGG